jgi:hypothetical protein
MVLVLGLNKGSSELNKGSIGVFLSDSVYVISIFTVSFVNIIEIAETMQYARPSSPMYIPAPNAP